AYQGLLELVEALEAAQAAVDAGKPVPSDSPATGGWDLIVNFDTANDALALPGTDLLDDSGTYDDEATGFEGISFAVDENGIVKFTIAEEFQEQVTVNDLIKALINAMGENEVIAAFVVD